MARTGEPQVHTHIHPQPHSCSLSFALVLALDTEGITVPPTGRLLPRHVFRPLPEFLPRPRSPCGRATWDVLQHPPPNCRGHVSNLGWQVFLSTHPLGPPSTPDGRRRESARPVVPIVSAADQNLRRRLCGSSDLRPSLRIAGASHPGGPLGPPRSEHRRRPAPARVLPVHPHLLGRAAPEEGRRGAASSRARPPCRSPHGRGASAMGGGVEACVVRAGPWPWHRVADLRERCA